MLGVDFGHVGEPWSPFLVVNASKRIYADRVYMVAEYHEVSRMERRIDAAHGVGEQEARRPHATEKLDGRDDRFPADAFVPVPTPAEGGDTPPEAFIQHELSGVADHGRTAYAGDVGIRDALENAVLDKRLAPAAAEYYAKIRRTRKAFVGKYGRSLVKKSIVHVILLAITNL
jgi:hypothetical protein